MRRKDGRHKFPRNRRNKSLVTAIAYMRVSTDEQALSPEAQRADIEAWSAENGISIAAWHEDKLSGSTPVDARPGLLLALEDQMRFKSEFIVVAARDRISRDMNLTLMLEYECKRRKCRLITAREDADEEVTPEGVLMSRVLDVMAEYERALIRRRTKAALAIAKSKGKILGRPGMLRNKNGREMVALVHDLRAAGFHSARICRYMKYKYGRTLYGTDWGPALVKRCLAMERPPEFLPFQIDLDADASAGQNF